MGWWVTIKSDSVLSVLSVLSGRQWRGTTTKDWVGNGRGFIGFILCGVYCVFVVCCCYCPTNSSQRAANEQANEHLKK